MDNSVENATNRRRNFRPVIFIAIPVLVIAGIVVAILANKKPAESPKAESDTNSSKTEEKKEEKKEEKPEEKNNEEIKPEEKKEETDIVDGKTPAQQDQGSNLGGELTGVINYAESDGETVMIRVSIDQYLDSGTCLLELTSSNDSFSISDEIIPSVSTSSCGFDIATSLLNNGKFDIKVTLTSGNKTGLIKGEVDV